MLASIPSGVVTIVAFFVMLGLLVLVHELGHFLTAVRLGIRVDAEMRGQEQLVVGRSSWQRFTAADANEIGNHLSGKDSQLRIGLLRPPPKKLEGSLWVGHSVDEHQHAFGLFDVGPVIGDHGDGCRHLVLEVSLQHRAVDVYTVGLSRLPVDRLSILPASCFAVAVDGVHNGVLLFEFGMTLHSNTPCVEYRVPFCLLGNPSQRQMAYGAVFFYS